MWLEGEAKREWRRITPELLRLGLMTLVDRAALAAYCQAWARWAQAERILSASGMTVECKREDGEGNLYTSYVQQRPEVAIAHKQMALMKSFLVEFGLTPASRTRLARPEVPQEVGLDALLS